MSEQDDFQKVVAGDDWWRQAERAAQRDVRRSRRNARLRRASRWLPHAVLVCALAAGAGWYVQSGRLSGLHRPGTEQSSEAAPPVLLPEDLEADAYRGTPAEKYKPDADGIVVPPAAPLGTHSAAEVATALAATKRLLVLGRLDDRMLKRRDPSAYLSVLSPGYRAKQHMGSRASVIGRGASSLAPRESLLAPPRVDGTMTPALGKDGEITVVTRYVFVYALRPSWPIEDRSEAHVIVRADVTYSFVTGDRYALVDHGIWITANNESWLNISCAAAKEGWLALPRPTDVAGAVDTDAANRRAYSAKAPVPTGSDCHADRPAR